MSGIERYMGAPGVAVEGVDDFEEAAELARSRGWSDGLPIVPPTPQRVERMLAFCDRPWDEPVAAMPPRDGEVTPLRLAANAVMAGCRPEYFPLLLLAVETMCEPAFNLYGLQTTTHPVAPLVIVNGPVAREIGVNAGHNAFGPGVQANATLGRAIRLALLNIGGAIPTIGDMATMGQPGKYGYVVAENEAASPWEPLHVERGFDRATSTVTVVGAEAPHNINDHESVDAEGVLRMVAGTVATTGQNNVYYAGEPLVAFGPEHAHTIAADGYTKDAVRRYLFERAAIPAGRFSPRVFERRIRANYPQQYRDADAATPVPVAHRPEDIMLIVLGGAGKHSMYLPTFGDTRSVTRPLRSRDGREAKSVQDFRAA